MNVVATYLLNAANGVQRVYWYGWDQQSIVGTLMVEPDGGVPVGSRPPGTGAFKIVDASEQFVELEEALELGSQNVDVHHEFPETHAASRPGSRIPAVLGAGAVDDMRSGGFNHSPARRPKRRNTPL